MGKHRSDFRNRVSFKIDRNGGFRRGRVRPDPSSYGSSLGRRRHKNAAEEIEIFEKHPPVRSTSLPRLRYY
eukprot:8757052-Pyramimonas_sp.AAC.1